MTQIEVDIAYPRADRLMLSYALDGKLDDVLLSPAAASTRRDKLWKHTCLEAFIRPSAGNAYYEFNFAPSTEWAAFWFSSYRSGRCVAMDFGVSVIEAISGSGRFTLRAELDFSRVSGLSGLVGWRIGLATIIEDVGHQVSHWALAHPPGKPDFHHADCFVHELTPPISP